MIVKQEKSIADILNAPKKGPHFFGREHELNRLSALLHKNSPIVSFIYGLPGIGKSTLLSTFLSDAGSAGHRIVYLDGNQIEPTPGEFSSEFAKTLKRQIGLKEENTLGTHRRTLIAIDNYEHLWLLDSWLREQFLPVQSSDTRLIAATTIAPSAAWVSREPWYSLTETIEMEPLSSNESIQYLMSKGLGLQQAQHLYSIVDGYPMALMIAARTQDFSVSRKTSQSSTSEVLTDLASIYLNKIEDNGLWQILMECSLLRRINRPMLSALRPGESAKKLYSALKATPFMIETPDGLSIHDAVRSPLVACLNAENPSRIKKVKRSAWSVIANELKNAHAQSLWRYSADTIYLLSDPVIREAFFHKNVPFLDVVQADQNTIEEILSMSLTYDGQRGTDLIEMWWRCIPEAFKAILNKEGHLEGFYLAFDPSKVPIAELNKDPLTRAWTRHMKESGMPTCQKALFIRRWLSKTDSEIPSPVQAAAWLDIKRTYLEMRPYLRHVYLTLQDVSPYASVATRLGFKPHRQLSSPIGNHLFTGAVLDMGPSSVDGWLQYLLAQELGISPHSFLNPETHEILLGGTPVALTSLEFKVASYLYANKGTTISRDRFLDHVWGLDYHGGSNVVDTVIKSLRSKMGDKASAIKTIRGQGYALILDMDRE